MRFPAELADLATAVDLHADRPVEPLGAARRVVARARRAARRLDAVVAAAAARSATLGRRVRVELAREHVRPASRRALTDEGFLVIRTDDGTTVVTAGDVVHLRRDVDRTLAPAT